MDELKVGDQVTLRGRVADIDGDEVYVKVEDSAGRSNGGGVWLPIETVEVALD